MSDYEFYNFFNLNKEYFQYSTDASLNFADAVAYSTLGHCLGREPKHLIQPLAVYHNAFITLVGESTKARKTTAQTLAMQYFPQERLIMADSPEALYEVLSKQNEAYQSLGEFTVLLKGSKSGNFRSGFVEAYNDFHDCQPRGRRLRSGKDKVSEFFVEKPYLSLLSTITDQMLHESVTTELAYGGFFPRWLFVQGKGNPRQRGRICEDALKISTQLSEILKKLVDIKKDANFAFSDEALDLYNQIEQELTAKYPNIDAYVGRYLNYLIAFADLQNLAELIGIALDDGSWCKISSLSSFCTVSYISKISNNNSEHTPEITNAPNETNINNNTNVTNDKSAIDLLTKLKERYRVPILITQTRHLLRAKPIIINALDTASEMMTYVELWKPLAIVRKYLQKYLKPGETITRSKLMCFTNRDAKEMDLIQTTLFERGELRYAKTARGGPITYEWLGFGGKE